MKGIDDHILVQRIKEGDRESFKKLYNRYHQPLYYLSKKYLKDEIFAKDAVQDIFVKVWKKRDELNASSSIKSFLFTMLKNHLLNMIRDKKNHRKILNELKHTDFSSSVSNPIENKVIYSEYLDFLKKAIKKLSPAERKVFQMKSFEGLSNDEIAERNEVSVNTVKTQYYLSSKFVRNYLKKHADLFIFLIVSLFQVKDSF
ncbi:RNA polymerase sigma-70 factor, ECF subfamily [Fodinibius roseus]|uniref:RNA polymerase sigma-70 factor, ECF subfamily n=1 Tax=Fodinibius roseus TaxID=1194090 RepID=A0A1M5L971_9BACT|nr:RNA polymerase sigma-70 factor [Fodinibius roseus]SHG61652.1 RNA polymerase sigma-70 factor, ECF subfamily [Fodinibius roseus]